MNALVAALKRPRGFFWRVSVFVPGNLVQRVEDGALPFAETHIKLGHFVFTSQHARLETKITNLPRMQIVSQRSRALIFMNDAPKDKADAHNTVQRQAHVSEVPRAAL